MEVLMGITRGVHDIATAVWAGGLYLLLLVVMPVAIQQRNYDFALALQWRLRWFVYGAIVLLVVTGILEVRARTALLGVSLAEIPGYRQLLLAKLVLVGLMIVVAVLRQQVLFAGFRRASRVEPAQPEHTGKRRRMKVGMMLLGANTLLMTAVLILSGILTARGQLLLRQLAGAAG